MTQPTHLNIPIATQTLTEATSIALAKQITCKPIATPLQPEVIATTYVCVGEGEPPILLLHGFDSSVMEFRRLLPLLAAERETWAVDLLGFGFGDRPPSLEITPLTIKTHLYHTWKTLIQRPVVLVGASMGGAAAIDFALTYPEAVRSLVLLDSAGLAPSSALGKTVLTPLIYLATEILRNSWIRQQVSRNAYHDPSFASVDALCCSRLHLTHPRWRQALVSFTQSGGYSSFQQRLSKIQQPTLILWGKSDRILGIADAERFRAAIPQSQLQWVDACGHVPHLEQPQVTAQAILEFCKH